MTMPTNTGENPTDLNELVLLKNKAFESIILHCRTHCTMMIGYKITHNDPDHLSGRLSKSPEWSLHGEDLY